MDVNSLPKTVTRQRRDCNQNPGPTTALWITIPGAVALLHLSPVR